MQTDDQNLDEFIRIDSSDLPLEISITESDIQKAAEDYMKQNPDFIFLDQKDIEPEKSTKFYEQIRQRVTEWAEKQGVGGKYLEFILIAPDLFLLLVRLAIDNRVQPQLRTGLIFVVAYFISPIDPMPEAILGPAGYLDDVVITSLAILKLLKDTDEKIIREHWAGKGDIVALINKIVGVGESLVGTALWSSMKKKIGVS